MIDLTKPNLPTIKEIITEFDLAPKKSLGQNFLFDVSLTEKIVYFAKVTPKDILIEIGPGPGALTRAMLLSPAQKIIALEKDERAFKALSLLKNAYPDRLFPILGDALIDNFIPDQNDSPIKLIANLPYNISTVILTNCLSQHTIFDSLTLMFQKEVADRINAKPSTKSYGRLSVLTQWLCDVQKCFDISPKAFYPPPKVTSTVLHLIPKKDLDFSTEKFRMMERITALAFGQRRKMLRQTLKTLSPMIEEDLAKLNINPTDRAENLSIEDFVTLVDWQLSKKEHQHG